MDPVKTLMSYFSYIFHALLALSLIAVSALALATNPQDLNLPMLPWTGATLTYVVLCAAAFGLATVLLAVYRKLRILFFLWSLAVFALLVKGYVFSGYRFANGSVSTAGWMIGLSLVALIGAWFQWRSPRAKRTGY